MPQHEQKLDKKTLTQVLLDRLKERKAVSGDIELPNETGNTDLAAYHLQTENKRTITEHGKPVQKSFFFNREETQNIPALKKSGK